MMKTLLGSRPFNKFLGLTLLLIATLCFLSVASRNLRVVYFFKNIANSAKWAMIDAKWARVNATLNPQDFVRVNNSASNLPLKLVRFPTLHGSLRKHPANPHYFTDSSGRAILLSGSHTWTNLQDGGGSDPPPKFDYLAYLNFLETNNHNFFRLWTWEQSRWTLSTADDNYWIEPTLFSRTGPGLANDGKPKYDLTQFNQDYFARLRDRVAQAADRGFYVSIMLFNGWSVNKEKAGEDKNNPWRSHPFNAANNINGVNGDLNGDNSGSETHTLANPKIRALQEAYIRKVIDTTNEFDNVLYEISNESQADSQDWQYYLIKYIKSYEASKPKQHPVGMTFADENIDKLLASPADWISPNEDLNNPPVAKGSKVIVADTDHLCGICGDRFWAWKSFTRGENPVFMDGYDGAAYGQGGVGFIFNDPRWVSLRKNLGYILTYATRMNLAAMKPRGDLASTDYCLAHPSAQGAEYLVYLPSGGQVTVDLSDVTGTLTAEWLAPETGKTVTGLTTTGGNSRLFVAPFEGDAVLYLKSTE